MKMAFSAIAFFVVSSVGSMPWSSFNLRHEDLMTGLTNFADQRGDRDSTGVQLADDATVCVTPQGTCPAPANTPKGAPCQCSSAAGTFYGVAR
jgi:hypothetical protein